MKRMITLMMFVAVLFAYSAVLVFSAQAIGRMDLQLWQKLMVVCMYCYINVYLMIEKIVKPAFVEMREAWLGHLALEQFVDLAMHGKWSSGYSPDWKAKPKLGMIVVYCDGNWVAWHLGPFWVQLTDAA